MADMETIMIIGEKETFLVRALMKKIRDEEMNPLFVLPDINEISSNWGKCQVITYYIDSDNSLKEEVFRFLNDKLSDDNRQIILIGDSADIKFAESRIPSELIHDVFIRPLDSEEYIDVVKEYLSKIMSGEFKKSILIVDDDPSYLSLVRGWLKDIYKVAMVTSGLQAIKWLGRNKADLILLDHEMPVTSGPQVLEMLRSDEDTKNIPVIFLTGKSDKESVMAVVNLKPEGYLLKNISRTELVEKINEFFILHR